MLRRSNPRSLPLGLRLSVLAAAALASPAAVRAAAPVQDPTSEPRAASTTEAWFLASISGKPAGYQRVVRREFSEEGRALVETRIEMVLRLKRMDEQLEVATTSTTVEDQQGRIVRIAETTRQPGSLETAYAGRVTGDLLEYTVTTAGAPRASDVDWSPDVIGPEALRARLRAMGFEPGATFTCKQFQFGLGEPQELRVTVAGPGTLVVGGAETPVHEVVMKLGNMLETTSWFTAAADEVKTVTKLPGMFSIEAVLADREAVAGFLEDGAEGAADGAPVEGVEVFTQTMIEANVRLADAKSLDAIVLRVRPREGATLPQLEDERQSIVGRDDETGAVLLCVVARAPAAGTTSAATDAAPAAEFLAPNAMIQSDEPEVAELARELAADAAGAWETVVRLTHGVHRAIGEKSMDVMFASALEVCRSREGDCTEHAVLLAALCRAEGIPARVAMGLANVGRLFGGHAWTEAWIDGSWYAVDATFDQAPADPTHIRFMASALRDGWLGENMVQLFSGLGGLDLEIVSYTRGGIETKVE